MIGRLVSGMRLPLGWTIAVLVVVVLAVGSLMAAAWLTKVRNNPASRVATIESLVEQRDWAIDRSFHRRVTTDKVRVGRHYYSSKPPVFSVMGAVVYNVLKAGVGWRVREPQREVVFVLRMCMQILPFFLGIVVAGRFLRGRTPSTWIWFWGFAAFALGTFVFAYSATINNHSVAALLMLASFAGAVRLSEGRRSQLTAFGVGVCASLGVTLDFGTAIFALTLPFFLLGRASWRELGWLAAGAVIPAFVHFHLTLRLSGSFEPFYNQPELYRYRGSYWNNPIDYDAVNDPLWRYALHSLVGHHGFFAMTPLLFLALPALWLLLRRPGERRVAIWAAVVALATMTVYIIRGPHNYGGTAMGMRWFIPVTPLLWYLAMRYASLRADRRWVRVAVPILVIVGIFHAAAALPNPWANSPWNLLFRELGLDSVSPHDWRWR